MKQNLKKYPLKEYIVKENHRYQDLTEKLTLKVFGVSNTEGVTETQHKRSDDLSKYLLIKEGFFAYNPYRINVGSIGLVEKGQQGLVSPAYVVFRTDENKLLPELLLDFLKSKEGLKQINKYARGTVRKALRFEDLEKIEMPIPDIVVQKKILKQKRSFDKKASKLIDTNTIQRDTIQDIYKEILQDAITGKLSEECRKENPNIESAEILLEKIKKEKEKLIKEGKIKKQKALPPITEEDIPFEIPDSWVWCKLGEVSNIERGKSPKYDENGAPKMLNQKCVRWFDVDPQYAKTINIDWYNKTSGIYGIEQNDVLVNSTGDGTIGRSALASNRINRYLFDSHILRLRSRINQKYIVNFINSSFGQKQVNDSKGATSTKQHELGVNNLSNFMFPLPPLSEQQYIVERIESLFTKLDKIKELNTANKNNIDLLNQVVLKEIFESNND